MKPIELRQKLLNEGAEYILDAYLKAAKGEEDFQSLNAGARTELWGLVRNVIEQTDDPSPMASLTDGSISNRIDAVLADVAGGKLTPAEGKRVMSLLQAGFEMTELSALVARLEAVEKAK